MTEDTKPYTSEAEKAAATKPVAVPDRPEAEIEEIEDNGEPLGGNLA